MDQIEQIARVLCRQKAEVTSSGLMVGEFLDRWVDEHWQIEVPNAEMILPFIAAERERCAALAHQYRDEAGGSESYRQACAHIEAAIRSQP